MEAARRTKQKDNVMAKTTISNEKGIFTEKDGNGLTVDDAITFKSTPKGTVQAKTDTATLVEPGVYTIAAGGIKLLTLPLASAVPGGLFIIRAASAHAHVVTASAETAGTQAFILSGTAPVVYQSSRVELTGAVGNSVSFVSDGKKTKHKIA